MAWLRTLLIWLGFLGSMFGGAALLLTTDLWWLGLLLLLAPVGFLAFLTLAHYARERDKAKGTAAPGREDHQKHENGPG